jgi:hypothetical protein
MAPWTRVLNVKTFFKIWKCCASRNCWQYVSASFEMSTTVLIIYFLLFPVSNGRFVELLAHNSRLSRFSLYSKLYNSVITFLLIYSAIYTFFPMARQPLGGLGLLIFRGFTITHIFRHTTLGRTPLDEWSTRRRDLYLTTHNNHKRQTFMP